MENKIDSRRNKKNMERVVEAADLILSLLAPGSQVEVRRVMKQEVIVPGQQIKYRSIFISVPENVVHVDIRA